MTHLCATTNCGRPTDVVICPGCVADLTRDLRHLATGGVDSTGRPIPGLLADLTDTITRQAMIGERSKGSAERALPYHAAAAALGHQARNELVGWARMLMEDNPHLNWPADDMTAIAVWLAQFPSLLAMLDAAGDMVDAVYRLTKAVRRMVDLAPERLYLGQCSQPSTGVDGEPVLCPEDLYGLPNRRTVKCWTCGTEHNLEERRETLRKAVEDQLATAVECTRAMPALLGGTLSDATIRSWVSRGKLTQHAPHPHDGRKRPRYRVGDVLDLASGRDKAEAS